MSEIGTQKEHDPGVAETNDAQAELIDELVRRLQRGDDSAFDPFYRATFHTVYRMVFRLAGSDAEIEDTIQEVYTRLYRKIGTFEWRCRFSTWVYRVCANVVSNRRRRQHAWKLVTFFSPEEMPEQPTPGPSAQHNVEKRELSKAVYKALEGVPEKKRTVFILYEIEERTVEEIAEIVAAPVNTVYSRLRHARAEFKSRFTRLAKREGFDIPEQFGAEAET